MNFKRAKVVMLPTNEKVNECPILHFSKTERLNIRIYSDEELQNSKVLSKLKYTTNHLYIVSDDEIKESDFCIYEGSVVKATSEDKVYKEYKASTLNKYAQKIIATTDKSLTVKSFINKGREYGKKVDMLLSQPSQMFIKKYIEEYNKGNRITDVLVEYEEYAVGNYGMSSGEPTIDKRIKVNSKDNTITIKKIRSSWNRKEVIELLKSFADDCENDEYLISYEGRDFSGKKRFNNLDEWIEENL